MSYRSLYEVVPLMSSGLLRSTGAGRPCRSFAAVARVMANAASPSVIRGDPWSLGVIPLEDIVFSRSALRNTSRMMREMVSFEMGSQASLHFIFMLHVQLVTLLHTLPTLFLRDRGSCLV